MKPRSITFSHPPFSIGRKATELYPKSCKLL
jgi:hypothetical protein